MRPTPIPTDDERDDFKALRERSIALTPSIRRILWVAIDWHDVSRDAWAAEIIRSTPDGQDPVKAVVAALKNWQAHREEIAARGESYARYLHKEEAENAKHSARNP